ncbi:glutathione S-transferase family protein [Methylocystis echinoides]|uniref:Glutathione S-transferase n=1 Tax=Methylocystis echinoides TaxID=29468 RepID=A0A9W6GR02_9HYPH|nr:glutathione S-transferase C-terminal domain-containing protein [Methylocystis echinoides]GLI91394.1 glutathione S-transferase [Methylocystis echinoides]
MLTLYYHPGACSLAAHIALEWIGAPYKTIEVEFGDKDYLKINPAGAVPALDDGAGWVLTQDAAILRFLARRHPDAGLAIEGDEKAQAEADRWSFFITGDLHPAFFPLFVPNRYTRAREKEAFDDIRAAAKALTHRKFALVDAHLTNRRFFLGEKRSYLDAYVFPMERWARTLLDDGLAAFPAVRAHHDMMAADPAVQKALAAEGA